MRYPQGKNGTSYTVPAGTTDLRVNAFKGSVYLEEIALPTSLAVMGAGAMQNCMGLRRVTMADDIAMTAIPENAFMNCYLLADFNVADGISAIGDNALAYCGKLTGIRIPDGVTSIGANTFSGCGALSIYGSTGSYAQA
ncbi:hypothetical protein SDC9_177295 [bioreactor metagenome]|uniref:Leucine-rich repeat domain-containing protein n=1 Tax=bioreactor metagenome TaxID=1076179 RepID=A0A645GV15_9ZZZZ